MTGRIGRVAATLIAGVLLGAMVLAGCGSGGNDNSGGQAYVEPKGAATETIPIEAGNFYFKPDKISTNAGIAKIELTAKNGIHDFVFDGAYAGFTLEVDGGGGTQSKKIDLKPGTYTFYCSIAGHRAAGMEGTLTVK